MEGPFTLREGSPGGERYLAEFANPWDALVRRDVERLRAGGARLVFAVIGRDTDPPETGEVEWCEGCGKVAVLASAEICEGCEVDPPFVLESESDDRLPKESLMDKQPISRESATEIFDWLVARELPAKLAFSMVKDEPEFITDKEPQRRPRFQLEIPGTGVGAAVIQDLGRLAQAKGAELIVASFTGGLVIR